MGRTGTQTRPGRFHRPTSVLCRVGRAPADERSSAHPRHAADRPCWPWL